MSTGAKNGSSAANAKPRGPYQQSGPTRVGFLLRVSSDEQDERGTIANQRHYLERKYAADFEPDAPQPMMLVSTYEDGGVSGAVPLGERPAGQRLIRDCAAGLLDVVIVYRLDRLGRTARVLLDAHDQLASYGVAVSSATEPFDTRTSIGRFLFQLLGSIAELERETVRERMTLGRDRVAREGKFINGPVPFGYDVSGDGFLVPSTRRIPEVGVLEVELVRELFDRVARGESSVRLAFWLRAAGVPSVRRYYSRKRREGSESSQAVSWSPARICRTIGNSTYKGVHLINSRFGVIERSVVPLVDAELWAAANAQLSLNRRQSFGRTNPESHYLLRGLIRCENCGRHYVGQPATKSNRIRLYRCNGAQPSAELQAPGRCSGRSLPADALESRVWQKVSDVVRNPGPTLEELQARATANRRTTGNVEERIRPIRDALAATEQARGRVLELTRRGRLSIDEADAELVLIGDEAQELQRQLAMLSEQSHLSDLSARSFEGVEALLSQIAEELDDIEQRRDHAARRYIVERLVSGIRVRTLPSDKKIRRPYTLNLRLRCGDQPHVNRRNVVLSRKRTTTSKRS